MHSSASLAGGLAKQFKEKQEKQRMPWVPWVPCPAAQLDLHFQLNLAPPLGMFAEEAFVRYLTLTGWNGHEKLGSSGSSPAREHVPRIQHQ